MNSKESFNHAISTEHCINGNEVYKIIEINPDRSWKMMISRHQIDPVIIGLQNITANSLKNVNIIFNTVKQSTICRGKPAEKEQRSTQFRLLQEWNLQDSPNIERRVSSKKCNGILSFTALSDVCPTCIHSREKGNKEPVIPDETIMTILFPNATEEMINHLKEQSKLCKSNKDLRGNKWERETIRIALRLWNRSPQVS